VLLTTLFIHATLTYPPPTHPIRPLQKILASICSHGHQILLEALLKFLIKNPTLARNPRSSSAPLSKRALIIACRNNHASLVVPLIRHRTLLQLFYDKPNERTSNTSSQRKHSLFSLTAVAEEEVTPLHVSRWVPARLGISHSAPPPS
jgi:hypothetical protein